jgi:hypothetical protein
MNRNFQIMRGLERVMCNEEGERLQGLYGLSGMGSTETFTDLANVLAESGFVDVETYVRRLRTRHRRDCDKIAEALPTAVTVTRMLQAASDDPEMLGNLFSKIGKVLKKVVKVATKLSPSHLLAQKLHIDKFSPSQILASKIDPAKVKVAKAVVTAGVTPTSDPLAAGAAVLANESGVPLLATPAAQDFAQQLVASGAAPGSSMPTASMSDAPPPAAADDGTILGMQPMVAAGVGVAALGALYLLMRKKGR